MGIPLGSKILVTGATGFLGGRSVECLRQHYEVTATGQDEKKGREFWKKGVRFLPGDLSDQKTALELCSGQEYVFNCAGMSSPWGHYQDFYQSNAQSVANLIYACEKKGVNRLVHISTASIYFNFRDRLDLKESSLPNAFVNDYASTKYLAEKQLLEASDRGFDAFILRPSAIFGPGDCSFFPGLIRKNAESFLPLMRGGRVLFEATYVDNVVDAMILAAGAPGRYRGRAYNITNDQPIHLIDLYSALFRQIDVQSHYLPLPYFALDIAARLLEWRGRRSGIKAPAFTRYSVGMMAKSLTLNIDRAKKELGYYPRISLEEGIARFAKWWRAVQAPPGMVLPSADRMLLQQAWPVIDEDYYDAYDDTGNIRGA